MTPLHTTLLSSPLFHHFTAEQLTSILPKLAPTEHLYKKGEVILLAGYKNTDIHVITSGEINATKETNSGKVFLVARTGPGGLIGDVLSVGHNKSPVTVTARTTVRTLAFSCQQILAGTSLSSDEQRRLLANILEEISQKYFALDARVDMLLMRSLRQRIAFYLLTQAALHGNTFTIPYTRAGLAHFLGCERSALSRELSRMAQDGLLHTERKRFTLLKPTALNALLQ